MTPCLGDIICEQVLNALLSMTVSWHYLFQVNNLPTVVVIALSTAKNPVIRGGLIRNRNPFFCNPCEQSTRFFLARHRDRVFLNARSRQIRMRFFWLARLVRI